MPNAKYNGKDHKQIESNRWGPTHYIITNKNTYSKTRTQNRVPAKKQLLMVYTKGPCNLKWSSSHAFDSELIISLGWWAAAEELPDALLHLVTLRVPHPSTKGRRTTQAEVLQKGVPVNKPEHMTWSMIKRPKWLSKHCWSATERAESMTEQATASPGKSGTWDWRFWKWAGQAWLLLCMHVCSSL
jgi:hypothetical protein